eukprot:scaffold27929_cov19-Tisochrysis_lutea.AAC.1
MAALVREACVLALKESMRTAARTGSSSFIPGSEGSCGGDKPCVHARHFEEALGRVVPSVSRKDQRCYDALRSRLRSSRGRCVCVFYEEGGRGVEDCMRILANACSVMKEQSNLWQGCWFHVSTA